MDILSSLERILTNLSALVGILVGVVTLVGFWFGRHRRAARSIMRAGANQSELDDRIGPPVFVASGRFEGRTASFVDRARQLRRLASDVRSPRSVVLIEGVPGVGKTALAAALCSQFDRRRRLRRSPYRVCWAFCAERPDLSLSRIALGLADLCLPGHDRVRAAVAPAAQSIDIIDVPDRLPAAQPDPAGSGRLS